MSAEQRITNNANQQSTLDNYFGWLQNAAELTSAVGIFSYGAYFDSVIINHDQERAYRELLKEIAFIEREPQWVPKHWLDYE